MILRVDDIKRPLVKGEELLVPCIIKEEYISEPWDTEGELILKINPVINHPHNDVENGQFEVHYHLDYRFIDTSKSLDVREKIRGKWILGDVFRPQIINGYKFEYFILPVINEDFTGITPVEFIKNSKLKHKCIHKGRCPHRGYDLSQVPRDENGDITCPLHGLQFDINNNLKL